MQAKQFLRNTRRHKRLKFAKQELPFFHLVPNMVTLTGLMIGFCAIRWALIGDWDKACLAVVACCVTDFLDGGLARLLKATSSLGAELDSFSDLISFGVTPALMLHLYVSTLSTFDYWPLSLIFVVCCTLRLARFNISPPNMQSGTFFQGVPSPSAALLVLAPIVMHNMLRIEWAISPFFFIPLVSIVAALMISKIPTISLKKLLLPRKVLAPLLVVFCIAITLAIMFPWHCFVLFCAVYLGLIPINYARHRKAKRIAHQQPQTED